MGWAAYQGIGYRVMDEAFCENVLQLLAKLFSIGNCRVSGHRGTVRAPSRIKLLRIALNSYAHIIHICGVWVERMVLLVGKFHRVP